MGAQAGVRPTMTFYFENQGEYDKAWAVLKKSSGAEPDTKKLLELIKDVKVKDKINNKDKSKVNKK
jgi:hypothetical protein